VPYVSNENGPNDVLVAEFRLDERTGAVLRERAYPPPKGAGSRPDGEATNASSST
jgi:hypothetical protein